jgi:hypothetical protein
MPLFLCTFPFVSRPPKPSLVPFSLGRAPAHSISFTRASPSFALTGTSLRRHTGHNLCLSSVNIITLDMMLCLRSLWDRAPVVVALLWRSGEILRDGRDVMGHGMGFRAEHAEGEVVY